MRSSETDDIIHIIGKCSENVSKCTVFVADNRFPIIIKQVFRTAMSGSVTIQGTCSPC